MWAKQSNWPSLVQGPTVAALIDLGGFDNLFLQGRRDPPVDHVARVPQKVKEIQKTHCACLD